MYFTDKFPKAELKTIHAGLDKQSPGRRQPAIHKNITSDNFQYLSKVYSDMTFSRYAAVSQQPPSKETLSEIFELQKEIKNKDLKIREIQLKLGSSRSSGTLFKSKDDYLEYANDLKSQIREHQIEQNHLKQEKQSEVKKRFEEINRIRQEQEQRRQKELNQVLSYKNVLETQKNLRKNLEFSESQMFPALRGTHKSLFNDRQFETIEIPAKKNDNKLTISLSSLPEFYQPKFTKRHPKLMKRNPITGEAE